MSRKLNPKTLRRVDKIKTIDLNDGEEPIKLITNPSEETKQKIIDIIFEDLIKDNKEELDELTINLENVKTFIPIVKLITDIQFNKEDEIPFVRYLFKDPSFEGKILRDSIIEVIYSVLDEFMDGIENDIDINDSDKEEK